MIPNIKKVVSGGQTGVDRAALDTALELGIETGGWIPKGRRAEDGEIPEKYPNLKETPTSNYAERTALNVRDSDATLIISYGELSGGSLLTLQLADRYEKPVLHVDLANERLADAVRRTKNWLGLANCEVLNVAGPRADPKGKIATGAGRFLLALFSVPD